MNKNPQFGHSGVPIAGGVPTNKSDEHAAKAGRIGPGRLDQPKHPKGRERTDAPRNEPSHLSQRNPAHQRKSAP